MKVLILNMSSSSNANVSGEIPYLTSKETFHQWRFEFEGIDSMEEREKEPEDLPLPDEDVIPSVAFSYAKYNKEQKEKFQHFSKALCHKFISLKPLLLEQD